MNENTVIKLSMNKTDMSVHRELDPAPEHRMQFTFNGRQEHIAEVNIPNLAYPNQHIDIERTNGSRNHSTVADTVKITFNFGIESIKTK